MILIQSLLSEKKISISKIMIVNIPRQFFINGYFSSNLFCSSAIDSTHHALIQDSSFAFKLL